MKDQSATYTTALKFAVSVFVFFLSVCPAGGQEKTPPSHEELRVGDTVPDLLFKTMINYKKPSARLSDFKGKAVILDFWATYCVPCIASFPKLEKLQREFKDRLSVILLSNYDEKGIRSFYSKKKDLILPTAYYDHKKDAFDRLFPHREIPHYVWIGRSGRIYAITSRLEVNEDNIRAFLEEKALDLPVKNDSAKWGNHGGTVIDSIENDGMVNRLSYNPGILYQSMLMRYDPRLTNMAHVGVGKQAGRVITLQNVTPVIMMFYALGHTHSASQWRFWLDLKDSSLTMPRNNLPEPEMQRWRSAHYYTYRITLDRPDSAFLSQTMLRDLQWKFGLQARPKRLTVPYLVLRTSGRTDRLKPARTDTSSLSLSIYNITLKNRPLSDLVTALYRYHTGKEFTAAKQYRIPVFDQTDIRSAVDIDVRNVNITDMKALNKELDKYGLKLEKEEGPLDMIVISDQ